MHDVFNKLSPCIFFYLFNCSNEINNYHIGFSSAGNNHIKYSRCNQQLKSFLRLGTKIWNTSPQARCKLPKCVFKKNQGNRLLEKHRKSTQYMFWRKRMIMLAHLQILNNCSKYILNKCSKYICPISIVTLF